MKITEKTVKKIIRRLLNGEDYRIEIVNIINVNFLEYSIDFFKRIVDAKIKSKNITVDWYKEEFLDPNLESQEIIINSGMNKKTIHNMYNSSTKAIVIDAANKHYDSLYNSIKNLIDNEQYIDLKLTIKFKDVSVDLNISESLIVINTLAVKRAQLRGGLWSASGKGVEKPLMQTLCMLYGLSTKNYSLKNRKETGKGDFQREVDFYLIERDNHHNCEIKLMGRGNPEGADAVMARGSKVFIADKLSDTNKKQLEEWRVEWVELRSERGFQKFDKVLNNLNIPHKSLPENIDKKLEVIFKKIFE